MHSDTHMHGFCCCFIHEAVWGLHVHRTSPRWGPGPRPPPHDPVATTLCRCKGHPHPPPMPSPHGPHPPLGTSAYGHRGKPSTTGWRACIVACARMLAPHFLTVPQCSSAFLPIFGYSTPLLPLFVGSAKDASSACISTCRRWGRHCPPGKWANHPHPDGRSMVPHPGRVPWHTPRDALVHCGIS